MAELSRLRHIWVKKGKYYVHEVDVVGSVRVANGDIFIDLEARVTRSCSGR